jgi:hypothetical protein
MSRQKKVYSNGQSRGGGAPLRKNREKRYPGSNEKPKTYGRLPYDGRAQ